MGRFLSEDPEAFFDNEESTDLYHNNYAYVENKPLNFVDISGAGKVSAIAGVVKRVTRHKGFIKNLARMKTSSLRKTAKSLEKEINRHKAKPPSKHHQNEIRTFQEQLDLANKELGRRGSQEGAAGVCAVPIGLGSASDDSPGGEIIDFVLDFIGFSVGTAE